MQRHATATHEPHATPQCRPSAELHWCLLSVAQQSSSCSFSFRRILCCLAPLDPPQDAYFLDSCSNISYFLEAGALKPDGRALAVPKTRALNKIGHALHELEPAFSSFAASPAVSALLRSLGFARPLPVQSMYIFKQPGIGGEVVRTTLRCVEHSSCRVSWSVLLALPLGRCPPTRAER